MTSGSCVWFHFGKEAVPIRWVIARDPRGEFETQALLCTNQTTEPVKIVEWFIRRWQVEVTFEESRRHLGIETQRQWSENEWEMIKITRSFLNTLTDTLCFVA